MKTDYYLLSRTVSKLWLIIIAHEDRLLNTTITCNYDFPVSNSWDSYESKRPRYYHSGTDNDNCWWCQKWTKDCLLIQGKPPANTCIFTFVWPDLWILLSLWKNWLRRSWSNCLEQPKQLVLLWVIDIKCRVGSHQSSDRTANPVASILLNHLICNQKCVMVTVCLPNDDQSWWTWCHFICLVVVVCLKQRYYCN